MSQIMQNYYLLYFYYNIIMHDFFFNQFSNNKMQVSDPEIRIVMPQ